MIRGKLIDDLVRDEGCELNPYTDTEGKLTIGIGRNLTDNGISMNEARHLLANDLDTVDSEAASLPWYEELDEVRQRAVANMLFNLGYPRFMKFEKMIAALEAGDYGTASREALDSRWARQVGARALRIAYMLDLGEDPPEGL